MPSARILIVEDEIIIAESLKKRLEGLGYEVVGLYAAGREALQAVSAQTPDLVLMDIMLKGKMDGIETAETIRKDHDIPVVYVTAYADRETLARAKVTEPFGYLIKPFKERELQTNIEIALYRSEMERTLRTSEAKYRLLIENSGSAIAVIDVNGVFLLANRTAAAALGTTSEKLVGVSLEDVLPEDKGAPAAQKIAAVIRSGRKETFETGIELAAGYRYYAMSVQPVAETDGTYRSAQILCQDITDLKRIDEERQKIAKFETISRLAEGFVHDFGNYLAAIMGNLTMAKMCAAGNPEAVGHLDRAEKASLWAQELVRKLLSFSKGGTALRKDTDLGTVIKDTARFALSFAKCTCDCRIGKGLRHINADPGQIGQMISNLVINAEQAMPDGGEIALSAENVTIGDEGPVPAGAYVRIAVADTGIGIPAADLERIFDPYFTTKPGGSGIGLAVVYSIVNNHGGHIDVTSREGEGTEFAILLPVAAGRQSRPSSAEPAAVDQPGRATVLVIDDEPAILDLVSGLLRDSGFKVVQAASGAAALEACASPSGRPDLAVLDLVMPGMDGFETFRRLRQLEGCVNLPVIILSGKRKEADQVAALELGVDDYIIKPFAPQEFVARVRALLKRACPRVEDRCVQVRPGFDLVADRFMVKAEGREIELTPTQFRILQLLASRPGWVFSRDAILDYIGSTEKGVTARTVNVHIRHLRAKMGKHGKLIQTVRGAGYCFEEPL